MKTKLISLLVSIFMAANLWANMLTDATISQDCSKNGIDTAFVVSANGHDYVDLGLSVYWATCNVGATIPEGYGDFFAWGETSPKSLYEWTNYKYCNGTENVMTKYNSTDGKTTLDLEDDAAHANWGGAWRTPTLEELQELVNISDKSTSRLNGVNGYIFIRNGKSIFLPAPFRNYGIDKYTGEYGCSSLSQIDFPKATLILSFDMGGWIHLYNQTGRFVGKPIRPVLPKTAITTDEEVVLTLLASDCPTPNTYTCSKGQQISIKAEPENNYTFLQWNDGNTDNPRTIVVTQDSTFTAIFSSPFNPDDPFNPGIYVVEATANPAEGGKVTGTGEYAQGEEAELTATANTGYHFVNWSDGIATASRTITVGAHDTAFVANFALNKYLVSFLNYNGDTLQSDSLTYGSTATYIGETPQKPASTRWSYTFKAWQPAIVSVSQDAAYTATYDSTRICVDTVTVSDYQKASDLLICEQTWVQVTESGILNIDEPTTAKALTFEVNNPTSAQIIGIENLTIQDVTMVLRLDPQKENVTLGQWYAFAVPFEVSVASGIRKEGASSAAVSGYDFVIDYYDGALRATTQDGWKRCNSSDILQPGKFYMMAVNGTQNKWTFTKHVAGTLSELSSISAQAHASTKAHHSGWNGLSNTLWQNALVELETSQVTLATRYNNAERVYEVVPISTTSMETASPFFVQVEQTSNVLFTPAETPHAQGVVARKTPASTNGAQPYYPLTLTSATTDGYVATSYIALSKIKVNAYVIGRDVQKMTGAGKSVPQISIKMYQTDLSAHEASIATGSATIPLALYAPKAGDYTLTLSEDLQGYDITLYNRAQVVFPDKMNTWTLSLTKGNTTAYQLVIKERKLPTDIENPESLYDATDTNATQKIIRNNQLLILRNGKTYNAQGGAVK